MAIQYGDNEYIRLFRKMVNWEWYTDVNTKVLFLHCLLRANWKPGSWKGIQYERGQFITSLNSLATETGLSIKMVRTALNHLIMTKEVTSEGQGKGKAQYRIITVLNYDSYQATGKQKASEGQDTGKAGANKGQEYKNIEEYKEDKEEREELELAPIKTFRFKTGRWENVLLSNEEAAKLTKEFGEAETRKMIDKLSDELATKENRYRQDGHYALICKWLREDKDKLQYKPKQKQADAENRTYTDADYLAMERKKLGIGGQNG